MLLTSSRPHNFQKSLPTCSQPKALKESSGPLDLSKIVCESVPREDWHDKVCPSFVGSLEHHRYTRQRKEETETRVEGVIEASLSPTHARALQQDYKFRLDHIVENIYTVSGLDIPSFLALTKLDCVKYMEPSLYTPSERQLRHLDKYLQGLEDNPRSRNFDISA